MKEPFTLLLLAAILSVVAAIPFPNHVPDHNVNLNDDAPLASDFAGVHMLVENNLDSSMPHFPVILISNKTSHHDGMHACGSLDELAYLPSVGATNFTSLFANTAVARDEVANESSFWVGGVMNTNSSCQAMAKNGTTMYLPCSTLLPTLCFNTAPKARFLLTSTSHQIIVNTTKSGAFQGYYDENSFRFLGIRYAQPPVGDLRFREPQPYTPPANGSDVQGAIRYGSACIQQRGKGFLSRFQSYLINQAPESEDCLFLNVYTPSLKTTASTSKLPVMVYIHGGGFITNSGSTPVFEPGNLVSRGGVVVVTFNYRLGFLGTFQNIQGGIPATEAPGNLATRDQILALQWVRDNIASFGGDPNRVTLFGESAGGYSIRALLATPSAYSLYQNVIMQSDAIGL
ncbi:hypothetical protein BGZ73_008910 [Actinomortierella ambigua]|nr:hypothetical protein BGZ73_008910 [Actinomortierella ambigua]